MRIPMVINRNFWACSIWGASARIGIESELKRKKYEPVYIYDDEYRSFDFEAFFGNEKKRLVAIIGSSKKWISETYRFFHHLSIDTLVVCNQPSEGIDPKGIIKIDYKTGTDMLIRHFLECGCKRTALYGYYHDSTTDNDKRIAYQRASARYAVFENREGLDDCYKHLKERLDCFDSILCVNDIAAVSLIDKLKKDGIKVPDDIQIACFGTSKLSALFAPSITHMTMNHEDIGRQTVSSYAYLLRSGEHVKLRIDIAGEIVQRDTTSPRGDLSLKEMPSHNLNNKNNFFDDIEINDFSTLNKLAGECDEYDLKIIKMSLKGETSASIAEELSFSLENVRYRKRQLAKVLNLSDFSKLMTCIHQNRFGTVFLE